MGMQGSYNARDAGHWDDDVPHTHRSETTSYFTAREVFSPTCESVALSPGRPALRAMLGKYSSRVVAIDEDKHSAKPPPLAKPQSLFPPLGLGSPDVPQVIPSQRMVRRLEETSSDSAVVNQINIMFAAERDDRLIYQDQALHILVLELVFRLILTPVGDLEAMYCSLLSQDSRRPHVLQLLWHHFCHERNSEVIAKFFSCCSKIGPDALRALRLLWPPLFQFDLYRSCTRIAHGPQAEVYECQVGLVGKPMDAALKLVDLPASMQDLCSQVNVYNEVALLERLRGTPGICQLYDYGVCATSAALVMKRYACSLRTWRDCLPRDPFEQVRLYLRVFADVLAKVKVIAELRIVHFDLKCDNILVEPICAGEHELDPLELPSERPPFNVILADFGEARMFDASELAATSRNHGTECVKSPEMLLVGNADSVHRETYDRRKRDGAGPPSDVWSLGCLLYELLTGSFLFHNDDWIQFFLRVTQTAQGVLPPDRLTAIAHLPVMIELLEFILVRDPNRRPPLSEVIRRVHTLLASPGDVLPMYKRPTSTGSLRKSSRKDAEHPGSSLLPQPGRAMREAVAKQLMSEPTEVAPKLLVGSAGNLVNGALLLKHEVGHVLLASKAGAKQPASDDESTVTEVTAALATCAAAEAMVHVLDVNCLEGSAPDNMACLAEVVTWLNELVASIGDNVLLAAGLGCEGCVATVALAALMLSKRKTLYEVLVNPAHSSCALQLHERHLRLLRQWEGGMVELS